MRHLLTACAALIVAGGAHAQAAPAGACAPVAEIQFSTPPAFVTQPYVFPSGDVQLTGCLYRPEGQGDFPVIVAVSGSDNEPTAAHIYTVIHAKAFAARGIGVFAYNKRGLGGSGGKVTDSDFAERGADAAAAAAFVRTLPNVGKVGLWGTSQAGWVVPQALRPGDGIELAILTSPSGVNPFEQVAFFIRNLGLRLGLSEAEASKAEEVHRAVARYYATGRDYARTQSLATRYAREPWFERFRANQEWDEKIAAGGRLLTPAELRRAWRERADNFAFYRSASTFADYAPVFRRLDRPTLIVDGGGDTLIPVAQSQAALRAALPAKAEAEFKLFEGAEHAIQDGPRVRAEYLAFVADWAAARLAG